MLLLIPCRCCSADWHYNLFAFFDTAEHFNLRFAADTHLQFALFGRTIRFLHRNRRLASCCGHYLKWQHKNIFLVLDKNFSRCCHRIFQIVLSRIRNGHYCVIGRNAIGRCSYVGNRGYLACERFASNGVNFHIDLLSYLHRRQIELIHRNRELHRT
ncbi:hypothetical protein D3C86_1441930 [compost metagenome]